MSNARDIIIRPLVTEKTLKTQENANTVVFQVKKGANKYQIKAAVEEIFNVKVEEVHTVNCKAKSKRMGRYEGKTNAIKKAYITLAEGNNITILSDK